MQGAKVLDTCDVDEARTMLAHAYCPHRVHLPGDGSGFHAQHVEAADSPLGIYRLGYGSAPVDVHPVPFRSFLLVSRPLAGGLQVGAPERALSVGAGESVALDPDSEHVLRFGPGCRLLTIKLPISAVDLALAADGDTGAALATGVPHDPAAWNAVTRFLVNEALPHGLLAEDTIMRRHTVQLVAVAVVASFNRASRDAAAGPSSAAAAFRRALDYIHDRAHEDIGLLDIANAAGLSPRALQYAFRRRLDTTPLAYLRDTRLDRARRELRADTTRTIADIAYSCGFGNLGRFAAEYRSRFGRLPSADHPRGPS